VAKNICETKFATRDGASIRVSATRAKGRVAVCVNWPAGLDTAPTVKWFESEIEAMVGYLVACEQVRNKWAAN